MDHSKINRKTKLDHLQHLLFDNQKQHDKDINPTQLTRVPRMDNPNAVYLKHDGVSTLKMP